MVKKQDVNSAKKAKKIKVTQVASPIGRKKCQRLTLIGLGLNKMHRSKELEASDSVLGMVNKVRHLLKVENL